MYLRIRGEVDFRELDVEEVAAVMDIARGNVDRATTVVHQALREGLSRSETTPEAPASRTGELVRSVKRTKVGRAKVRARATIYTRLHWAAQHEYGGRIGGKGRSDKKRNLTRVLARPIWRSTFERLEAEVDRILREGL